MNELIVSLTFDDGLDCHLDIVAPMLEKHGLTGTFFINLNAPSLATRMVDWQHMVSKGHELGNHTIFHPALSSYDYISEGRAIENYSLDRMRIELETANQLLSGLDGETERTFAYPCCNKTVGSSGISKKLLNMLGLDRTRIARWLNDYPFLDLFSQQQDYAVLMQGRFSAARAGGFRDENKQICADDVYKIPCISGDGLNAHQLLETVDRFQEHGNWLVFMFHGVGSGHHLKCEFQDFACLIKRLAQDKEVEVLTFKQAAKRVCGSNV